MELNVCCNCGYVEKPFKDGCKSCNEEMEVVYKLDNISKYSTRPGGDVEEIYFRSGIVGKTKSGHASIVNKEAKLPETKFNFNCIDFGYITGKISFIFWILIGIFIGLYL